MKARSGLLAIALILAASAPGFALPMPLVPDAARAHEGECVTVEGRAHVFTDPQRLGVDIVLDNPQAFEGYVQSGDVGVYPDLRTYDGKLVDISGVIQFHLGVPEIKMFQRHQLIMAPAADRPRPQLKC